MPNRLPTNTSPGGATTSLMLAMRQTNAVPPTHPVCQSSVCFQNTARIPRLHRQSGLSTPPCVRRNANRTNHRTRIQNVLTRGATTFTDGRTSTGLCDYPVLPSANSRHMPSTGTHIHDQRYDYTTATRSHCWRNCTSPTNLQKASESRHPPA